MPDPTTLDHVDLGDIVTVGTHLRSVRGAVRLGAPAGSLHGFLVLGEITELLTLPVLASQPASLYGLVDTMPVPRERVASTYEGVFRYWAPHLPPVAAAMGELAFRVLAVRGRVDPLVVVYRDVEPLIFQRAFDVPLSQVAVTPLARADRTLGSATRHAALVHAS